MVSIIITSYKEPKSIAKAVRCVGDPKYSGVPKDYEVIQISPDKETLDAGLMEAKRLRLGKKFRQLIDPHKGKPFALNYALQQAKGDILVLTDGEVHFKKNAVKNLIKPFENKKIGGSTGQPVSMNKKDNFYGYMSHLLVEAAHHRRTRVFKKEKDYFVSNDDLFPMSGYILALRKKLRVKLHQGLLTEDAYMTFAIREKGYEIAYVPSAKVAVKYPTSFKDDYAQTVRALGGNFQIEQMGKFKRDKNKRTFFVELQYAFFVLTYAKSFREFLWSLWMFPFRLAEWVGVYFEVVILKGGSSSTGWKRIESTK